MEAEIRAVVAGAGQREKWQLLIHGYKISTVQNEEVLDLLFNIITTVKNSAL